MRKKYFKSNPADPAPLMSFSAEEISKRLFTKREDLPEGVERIPLKAIHINKCPVVLPAKMLDAEAAERRSLSRVLSRDSVDSNRLMLIPGINEGQPIFVSKDSESSLPAFNADMSPLQIADLVAMSMQQSLWNGQSTVTASNARDSGFTGISGFSFDLSVTLPGGQVQKGMAGGFIDEDRLYVNIFVADFPASFDQHESVAQQVIDSAVLRAKTIRRP